MDFFNIYEFSKFVVILLPDTMWKLVGLRDRNQNLKKIIVSIGGWNAGSEVFSQVVGDNNKRAIFITSISDFLNKFTLDGIDIDWEYPANRGGVPADKDNIVIFLRELRARLGNNKIISAAVGADLSLIGTAYDVKGMNQYLDFINLMTYDYHSGEEKRLGHNSPLMASQFDTDKFLNGDATVTAWLNAGATSSKILLGLAFYGRSFQLANNDKTNIGDSAVGPGSPGPYSATQGYNTFLEICQSQETGEWTTYYDNDQHVPRAYNGNQWIGYDNQQSVHYKSQYSKNRNLGGVMMWSVDMDDSKNLCGLGKFPLLNSINGVIKL